MTNKFISKFITSIGLFILFIIGCFIAGGIALYNAESKEAPAIQATIARHIATNAKVKQLLLDGTLVRGKTKQEVEDILKTNSLVLDQVGMDEIEKVQDLTIQDSDYELVVAGTQNNWCIAWIQKHAVCR